MTRLGWATLCVSLALTISGWFLAWTAVCVVGFVLLVLVVGSRVYVLRRPNLTIERDIQPPRVPKGLPAIAYLHLTNHSRSSMPAMVARQPYGTTTVRTRLPKLLGGQRGVRTYRLPTVRRGVFPIGPVELSRADPFGFANLSQSYTGDTEIWVYPSVLPFRPLPSGLTQNLDGPTSDQAQQGSITFHRLREYVVGDDLRMIHWKSYARTGKLVVRHNVDTSQTFTVVLVDLDPACYSAETFEAAIDVAASVVQCASSARSPVFLRTNDGREVGGAHSGDTQLTMDFLTQVNPSTSGSLVDELHLLRSRPGATALVVVTGELGSSVLPAVGSLRRKYERLFVLSVSPSASGPISYPGVSGHIGKDAAEICGFWNVAVGR
jgi:uncharacterized protein (DUF58 family)